MYQVNKIPKYGLMLKYLAMIMSKKELKALIDNYVKAKQDYWLKQKPKK